MDYYLMYLRKSRHDRDFADATVEETLARHKAILDKYAMENNLTVVKVYKEVVSGESISARPEVQKLLEDVQTGNYAGVLVTDISRLARGNSIDQGIISQTFMFSGTKIITPDKTYDPEDESDEDFFEFELFMSRKEYKTINKRLVKGRNSSASEGKWMGSKDPYGYRKVKLQGQKGYTLEIIPEEADIVRLIFDMYEEGMGLIKITNYLNAHKIPTKKDCLWTSSAVSHLMTNPVYCGMIRWKNWKTEKKIVNGVIEHHRVRNSTPELYEGLHEAIISKEQFDRVQNITNGTFAPVGVNKQFLNPFAGLLYCSVCGSRIERTTDGRNVPRYRCTNRICETATVYQSVIEDAIVTALREWFKDYMIEIQQNLEPVNLTGMKATIVTLEKELDKLSKQLNKAYDLVEQGVYTVDVFQERAGNIKEKISVLLEEKDNLQNEIDEMENYKDTRTDLIPKAEHLLNSYDQMTVEERNQVLKQILKRIEYTKPKGIVNGTPEIKLFPKF